MTPHWERGYRCHGYWLGLERVGFVGLPPRCAPLDSYGWDATRPDGHEVTGRAKTLRAAKRAVERTCTENHRTP